MLARESHQAQANVQVVLVLVGLAVQVARVRVGLAARRAVSKVEAQVGLAQVAQARVAQVVAVDLLVAQVAHQVGHQAVVQVGHRVDSQVVRVQVGAVQLQAPLVVRVDAHPAVASPSEQSVKNSTTCRRRHLPVYALHVATERLFV